MKKNHSLVILLVISITFSSCSKEKLCPEAEYLGLMELSDKTLSLIPYENHDIVYFSNEEGERLNFTVTFHEPYFEEKKSSKGRYLRTVMCPYEDWSEENLIVSLEDTTAGFVVHLVYRSTYVGDTENDPGNVDVVDTRIFDGLTPRFHPYDFVIDRKEMALGGIYNQDYFYDTIAVIEHNNREYHQVFKSPLVHSDFVPITYNHDFGLLSFYDWSETLWEIVSEPEPIGLVGSWELVAFDTCYRISPFYMNDYSELVSIDGESGRIHFYDDSTGFMDLSTKLVGQNKYFSWTHLNQSDTARFLFPSFSTDPVIMTIDTLTENYLNFHYVSFNGQWGIGGPLPFYFLKTERIIN